MDEDKTIVYQRSPRVLLRQVAGEMMLVPVDEQLSSAHKLYMLNETGAFLWNLLEIEMGFDEIFQAIESTYDVEEEQYLSETEEFLNRLTAKGFIEIRRKQ